VVVDDAVVRVPGIDRVVYVRAAPKLDESHAALDQPPRRKALASERLRDFLVESVEGFDLFGLLSEVHGLRRAGLHAVRKLVRCDTGRKLAHAGEALFMLLIQPGEKIEPGTLFLAGEVICRRPQIENRISDGAKCRPLIRSGQISRAPVIRTVVGP